MTLQAREAYAASGVDISRGAKAVDLIREVATVASRPEVVSGIGGFAGLVDIGDGRLLVAATDGVGTKLEVARLTGRLDTVGVDLVAMCANDVVCTGAEPLFFLDYLVAARVVRDEVARIVSGVAEGCRIAGCALLGGETAEHPGTMEDGRFDLAGFCVGVVEREALLGPHRVEPGDALLGLRSSGLHSNGFSLIRRVLLGDNPEGALAGFVPELGRSLGEELLEPTRIYVDPLRALVRAGLAASAAHITGGGFPENVPRSLPNGLGAEIDTRAWEPQPIFDIVGGSAGLNRRDLFGVFNMGIGMVVAVKGDPGAAVAVAGDAGVEAIVIGRVVERPGMVLR